MKRQEFLRLSASACVACAGAGLPAAAAAPDSYDVLAALLGASKTGRDHIVEQAGALSLIQGQWKYIEPNKGPRIDKNTNIELGNDPQPPLYDLRSDIGEKQNVAAQYPKKVEELAAHLNRIRAQGRTRL